MAEKFSTFPQRQASPYYPDMTGDDSRRSEDLGSILKLGPLNEAQRAGRACLFCASSENPMIPVGTLNGVRVFACSCPGL